MQTLVITSTVHVNSDLTVLTDPETRERQYVDSILFYLGVRNIRSVIICDNSGFDYSRNTALIDAARKNGKQIELLFFQGDMDRIKQQGKGYGEGEIMEYVMQHSRLISENPGFFKVTGRVIVQNIDRIIEKISPEHIYFQKVDIIPFRRLHHHKVDTRIYYCTRAVFQRFLLKAYRGVDDGAGHYLECTYFEGLTKNNLRWKCFEVYPRFRGVSGSTGVTYTVPPLKWNIMRWLYTALRVFPSRAIRQAKR